MKNGDMWLYIRYILAWEMMPDGPKKDRYEAIMDQLWEKLSNAERKFSGVICKALNEGLE